MILYYCQPHLILLTVRSICLHTLFFQINSVSQLSHFHVSELCENLMSHSSTLWIFNFLHEILHMFFFPLLKHGFHLILLDDASKHVTSMRLSFRRPFSVVFTANGSVAWNFYSPNINWILWLKEKACWQINKVYWKTRRLCREMMFFFFKLIMIHFTDRVQIIIDSPWHDMTLTFI